MTGAWSRCERVLWRRLADGALLLPPGDKEPFIVTGPGAAVWALLATSRDLSSMAEALASAYDITIEQAEEDIGPFLEALVDRAVITVGPAGS